MNYFNKIIKCNYDEQQAGSGNRTIKTSIILGILLFFFNVLFIITICVNNSRNYTAVMLQGDSVAAQKMEKDTGSAFLFDMLHGKFTNELVFAGEDGTSAGPVRKVSSEGKDKAVQSDAQTKKVYLTFDDGPSKNTDEILDILKSYHVKATFFVVGKTDDHSRQMYQRIVEEGHTIGMHSYSHDYQKIYKSVKAFQKDLDKIQNLLYDVTGIKTMYYRFPGGSSNTVSSIPMKKFINVLVKRGITYYDWNAVSGDAEGKNLTEKQMLENVMKDVEIHNTTIVLLHDASDKTGTVKMLPSLIEELEEEEIPMLPIDENTTVVQHVKPG